MSDQTTGVIPALHISLLSDFRLLAGEAPVTINVPRLQSLLAHLLLHREAPQSRSHLAFLLWPDSSEPQAHSNLRKLLHQLRQALPHADAFLYADRHNLHWRPAPSLEWTLDVREFERALQEATASQDPAVQREAYERASALYRGDLLPDCYDEWILPERDRLRQSFLHASERLVGLLEAQRDYDAAIKAAAHLLRQDPLQEAIARQLMRLHALHGDRAAALRVYHSCASLMERELGVEPGEATRALYESLVRSEASVQPTTGPLPAAGSPAPLIGRDLQWRQIQEVWYRAAGGRAQMALIAGEAGIGKTRLAEELLAWVGRQGMTAVSARCYPAQGRLAYAPVTAWLRADSLQDELLSLDDLWLRELVRLLPELLTRRTALSPPAPITEGWQRRQFFEALARAVLSARQPILLLLDDLHWCDHETLDWLHFLLRFQSHARLLLVGTVRTEEMPPEHPLVTLLNTLQRDGLLTELTLEPLSTRETASLAEHLAGHQLTSALLDAVQRETEGNPLFVVEMIRAGSLEQHTQAPNQRNAPLPPAVHTILTARLAQLSPSARELANVAAVVGREFSFAVLARTSGADEEAAVRGLDELWQRRIVREQGAGDADTYDFSHDKLRQAAYSSLSSIRRRFLHRRVAEALAALHADNADAASIQIATHYEQAGLPILAIPYYRQAGEFAQRVYANEDAIAAFQRAMELLAASGQARRELPWHLTPAIYERLGDVLEIEGRHSESTPLYRKALACVPAQESIWQARLYRKIGTTLDYPQTLAEALSAYREAECILEQAPVKSGPEWHYERLETQIHQMHAFFMLAQEQEMTRIIDALEQNSLIERYGTPAQRASFYSRTASMRNVIRDHYTITEETLDYCRKALAAAQESENPSMLGRAHFASGTCLLLAGDYDQAEEHLRASQKAAEQVGNRELILRCRLYYLPLVFRRREQVEEVRQAVVSAVERGEQRFNDATIAHRAWVAWRDGDIKGTERFARSALQLQQAPDFVFPFQWMALWPLIGALLAQERLSEAIEYVRMLFAPTQQRQPAPLRSLLEAALQAWDDGQHDAARSLLNEALPLAEREGFL